MKSMKILLAGAEANPFVKTGGLADVLGALPKALRALGIDARVMIPKHSAIKARYQPEIETLAVSSVRLNWREAYLGVQYMESDGVPTYFIDNEDYFGGPVYKGGDAENEQYMYFCKAVCEALPLIGFEPDVLHLNDWHTGMVPMLLKTQYAWREGGGPHTLFTIHNIAFQGKMDFALMRDFLSIPDRYYSPLYIEQDGAANMMKAALSFSEKITTVSPNYANELLYGWYGLGMERILSARRSDLRGILNGIDTDDFDPEHEEILAANFSDTDLRGKRICKDALRKEFSLTGDRNAPIVCMVSRLTAQKGFDLVKYALEELLCDESLDMRFVLLGSGDTEYQDFFNYIAGKYPGKAGVWIGYDEALAHRIYAGSDFLLMPSEFEPCGLSQMIAQRYGTLPIVRKTGGLVDTVRPYGGFDNGSTGFAFGSLNAHDMMFAIRTALGVYRDKIVFRGLRRNAMSVDNSFGKPAVEYGDLYRSMISG
ncbi:MAG: glycogen synthase [Clostridiales Family XIII bacterium]|jgi:starch synthase|nr:glycogen synthase [Clostridiales Family XIII bacterium]